MWHQVRGEPAHVAQAVGPPARAVGAGIFQAIAAADQHQQRRLLEGGKVGIDHLHAVFQRRQLAVLRAAQVPLPPPADGAKVDVVDVGMAVVPLAQPLDEIEMGFQDDGIIHVGNGERALPLVVGLKFLAADVLQPFRMVGWPCGGRTAHDTEGQLLPRIVGFLQHLVQELRVELPRLRLQFAPTPAGILDRGGNPRRQALVLLARMVECLPPDARVGEDFVCFLGLDDHLLRLGPNSSKTQRG